MPSDHPGTEFMMYAMSTNNDESWKKEIVEYIGDIYTERGYPDLVVRDGLVGIFYKGDVSVPRFACKEHSKSGFRRSRRNDCGQQDSQRVF